MVLAEIRQMIDEVVELTGAAPPELLDAEAPVLSEALLDETESPPFYLVGLIGGKNVGKSSLVNALVGSEITAHSSHGAGTEKAIAYAHEEQADALRELLDREVPGHYEIVTHATPGLLRQVLVDLPDIDSHHAFHGQITRRMLRHMLYPIWLQSVEKYADSKPRELLLRIIAGNAPRNMLFCLNKIDQVIDREGDAAARELRDESAARLAAALGIAPPKVWMISAIHPDRAELPALRELLTQEKPRDVVRQSTEMAARQTATSMLRWLHGQRLEQRLAAMRRLEAEAGEEVVAGISGPLIERITRHLIDDPTFRSAVAEEAMATRVPRWPVVDILHMLLAPAAALLRRRLAVPLSGSDVPEALIEQHLEQEGDSASALVQCAFARLQQSNPLMSRLYRERRLWEETSAREATSDLRRQLAETIERQRGVMVSRFARTGGAVGVLFRVLLTVGAIVWFPFAQPVTEAYLKEGGIRDFALVAVRMLGGLYLLREIAFLAVYFVCLWIVLAWDTRRRIDRSLGRWKAGRNLDPERDLTGTIIEWLQTLLAPIREARERLERLVQKDADLQEQMQAAVPTDVTPLERNAVLPT